MTLPPDVLMVTSLPLAAPWNGADKVLARTMVLADPDRRYVVQTGPDEPWPDHVRAHRSSTVPTMPGTRALVAGALYLARESRQAGVIHVVASLRTPSTIVSRLLRAGAMATRHPIVHSIPGIAEKAVAPAAFVGDLTIVFSQHSERLVRSAGIENVTRVFPPLLLARPGEHRDPEAMRRELDLGPLPVLYPAHLDPESGIEEAIRAFALLPRGLDAATLVLAVRSRPSQDREAAIARLAEIASESGVDDRVRWVTAIDDMPALISACAVTALVPHRLAGKMDLPLVILESLALGRPVVIADREPMSEALLGGGLLVPPGDPAALATALTTLLDDAALRESLAAAGRRRLLDLSDPSVASAVYDGLYRQAMDLRVFA